MFRLKCLARLTSQYQADQEVLYCRRLSESKIFLVGFVVANVDFDGQTLMMYSELEAIT